MAAMPSRRKPSSYPQVQAAGVVAGVLEEDGCGHLLGGDDCGGRGLRGGGPCRCRTLHGGGLRGGAGGEAEDECCGESLGQSHDSFSADQDTACVGWKSLRG